MANRSTFPITIDQFVEHSELQSSDKPLVIRFQELKLKPSLTSNESNELASLTTQLRSKLITAEDFNKLQDAITNLETFFRDETDGYIQTKQAEIQVAANTATTNIQTTKDSALIAIEQKKENVITYMDSTTAGAIRNDMGVMGDLATTDKTSLVKAINEVGNKAPSDASVTVKGIVMLEDSVVSTSVTKAATPKSIKTVNDALTTHQADYLKHTGYAVTTGSANAYIATLTPALSSYVSGVTLRLNINVDNTGASTVNVNGLGVKTIKKANGTDVGSGNLKTGSIYTLAYNGTSFILQGEGGDLSDADKATLITNTNTILGS